jgi:calcium-dependent protein kinase
MGVFEDEHEMNIVEELCSGGSLTQLLEKRGGRLSERESLKAMRAVIEVIAHCHSMGVLYRDVKPDNFLLSDLSSSATLKAIDFGISVFIKPGQFEQVMRCSDVSKPCMGPMG